MVVCKYFLQGTCKFGSNCKNEHIYTTANSCAIMRTRNPASTPVDIATLVKSVQNDMVNSEKGGQWLLSSYAPFKEKPIFTGFEEKLFEEVRYEFYEAMMNGTVEQYKQQYHDMLLTAMRRVRALQSPNEQIAQILQQIYNSPLRHSTSQISFGSPTSFGPSVANNKFPQPFGVSFPSTMESNSPLMQASSPFASQPQPALNHTPSSGNIFSDIGTASQSSFSGGSIFAQTTMRFPQPTQVAQSQSIFGDAMQSAQTQGVFNGAAPNASTPTASSPIFAGAIQAQVAAANTQPQPIFGGPLTSTFGGAPIQTTVNPVATAGNIFAQAAQTIPPFGQGTRTMFGQQAAPANADCYSPAERLTPDAVNCFMRDVFEFGRIPAMPPSMELFR